MMAVGVMVLLSIFGLSIASLVTTSHAIHTDQLLYDRTFYVAQAGIEYAMRKIYDGLSPVVETPLVFGNGSFTIGRDGRIVTVTATDGITQVVHSVTSPTQADCTNFYVENANLNDDGEKLQQIQFEKICLEEIVLDKMVVSWTNPGTEGLEKVRVESSTLYDQPAVPNNETTELADYRANGNNRINFNEIRFSHDMEGKTFTIRFKMGDGSAESYTFTPDDD